ncbi:MAG TPA: hypothetical protein PKA21_00605 [Kiritimatiellia bacterium]|nr:hypothetical protein [Kiritimatiellia bacterium]HMP96326.1 hypothetical protein [Kiritimatiellia bacterium]
MILLKKAALTAGGYNDDGVMRSRFGHAGPGHAGFGLEGTRRLPIVSAAQ